MGAEIKSGANTVVMKNVSAKFMKIYQVLNETRDLLTQYVDDITNGTDESLKHDQNFKKINAFAYNKIDDCIELLLENYQLFNDKEFLNILNNNVSSLHSSVLQLSAYTPYEISTILEEIRSFLDSFRGIEIGVIALKNANTIINNELKPKIEEVKEKVKDFDALQLALEQRETNKIYLDLHKKYHGEYFVNNFFFFVTIIAAVFFTLYTTTEISNAPQFSDYKTERNFWVMFITTKVLIATVTLTFGTLFLRRSAHAKKLKEQAYQTHVEINAFPIHVRSLKDEDKHELIKELALKYFGKELDQTQNDKVGDLMKDQLTAGTELIKASAELVKAKGGSTTPP
ncbi:hypothetical protein [Acinetobacter sp. TUM15064]|uniref:hypothetical protein n=1 Tax=Acinetobacter sp. TUM15064 TaxID=2609134 RepID=UPI00124E0A57|nr:hypothetical protein [Acinetobacter sp. TUM15064]